MWVRVPSGMAFPFCTSGCLHFRASVRVPCQTLSGACSVMVIIGASQALDPGSIPGRRRPGALAQSEECVLCKHEVRGSKPRCSILQRTYRVFGRSRRCSGGPRSDFRLGWPSGPRRSTQVRVSPGGVGSNPTPSTSFCFGLNFAWSSATCSCESGARGIGLVV